ncbi:MAG: hypothetical protein P4L36_02660 [Holophaga sp.]|nr:hypothetical protein [Holophaga sp.]
MIVYARVNQIGWVHLWTSVDAFEAGEASVHFFDTRVDPRWAEVDLSEDQRARLAAGQLVELEDPGYLD